MITPPAPVEDLRTQSWLMAESDRIRGDPCDSEVHSEWDDFAFDGCRGQVEHSHGRD